MKISIITVCFNSASTIEDTIKSVINQNYKNLEYIIVDGGSTDDTLDIIDRYRDRITRIITEPDKGVYDAMNKGVELASGDIIGILNSDDFYCSREILNSVVDSFISSGSSMVYGNLVYVDRLDISKKVRYWISGEYKKEKLNYGWIPPHPAVFIKKSVYKECGIFNLDFRIAADYEFLLRVLKKCNIIPFYINKDLVYMREGGFSASSLKQRRKGWEELKRAWEENEIKIPHFFITKRVLFKIRQYLIKT
jgi:glycosyltransferase involved in cell wall biosynthesis